MSHLQYTSPEGFGQYALKTFEFNQVVRVGDILHLSGQGGWKQEAPYEILKEINAQIDQAFSNVDYILKQSGAKGGWENVFRVNSYHVPLNEEAKSAMVRNFKQWMPNHKATWTCIGVSRLGEDDMRVEIEVQAHIPAEQK
ncbi:YjgF-like protein [Meredithblackwellia eburnea MCA 4105]